MKAASPARAMPRSCRTPSPRARSSRTRSTCRPPARPATRSTCSAACYASPPAVARHWQDATDSWKGLGVELRGRRRQRAVGGRRAEGVEERLEAGRGQDAQRPRHARVDAEAVRHAAREEDRRARAGPQLASAADEGHLPLEHVEDLVLALVHVDRRLAPGPDRAVEHRDRAVRLVSLQPPVEQVAEVGAKLPLVGRRAGPERWSVVVVVVAMAVSFGRRGGAVGAGIVRPHDQNRQAA